jgi:hypothetical protein
MVDIFGVFGFLLESDPSLNFCKGFLLAMKARGTSFTLKDNFSVHIQIALLVYIHSHDAQFS